MVKVTYPISELKAESIRKLDYINNLRDKSKSVSKSVLLNGTPEDIWEAVSHTDFINIIAGMNTTLNYYLDRESGGTWMHAETKSAGLPVSYEELPYEWSAPNYYRVERIYNKGPLKYLDFYVSLVEIDGKTNLTCNFHYVTFLPNFIFSPLIKKELNNLINVFSNLANKLQQGYDTKSVFFDDDVNLTTLSNKLVNDWQKFGFNNDISSSIADYIIKSPERLAYRVRPFEVAKIYSLDPLDLLKFCLCLARENYLHLMWDCRCPGCKGPKESFDSLNKLKDMAYCETCSVEYGLAFDQNLELTFKPNNSIREVSEKYFCAGSPGNTPHIIWQNNFFPEEQRSFKIDFKEGTGFVVRSLSCTGEVSFIVDNDGLDKVVISLDDNINLINDNSDPEIIKIKPNAEFIINNCNNYYLTLMFENVFWESLSVTAAFVQSVQEFHNLFSDQVLSKNETLPLSSQVFLDLDLINYSEIIDSFESDSEATSFIKEVKENFQQIINQHEGTALFQKEGQVIGLFNSQFDAISAAWSIRSELIELNLLYDLPLEISIGVGAGSCEVFIKDDSLSYSGEGVELSQKARDLSPNIGFVVLESLLLDPETEFFLDSPELEANLIVDDEISFVLFNIIDEMVSL